MRVALLQVVAGTALCGQRSALSLNLLSNGRSTGNSSLFSHLSFANAMKDFCWLLIAER